MIEPAIVAIVGATVSAAVEVLTRYWRERRESSEDVTVVTEAGEVLREPGQPAPIPPATRSETAVVTVASRDLDAEAVVRIVRALQPATKDESWLAKHGATLLVGLIAAAATVFTVLAPDEDTSPDCVAYVHELASLKAAFPNADAARLFGSSGVSFGDAEVKCGSPESFFQAVA